MMTSAPKNQVSQEQQQHSIESLVRAALSIGELSPAAEIEINNLVVRGNLSTLDCTMLAILRDAIQDGCIRRLDPTRYSHFQR